MLEDCGTGTSSPKGKMPARCRFVDAGTINGSAGRTRGRREVALYSGLEPPPLGQSVTATKG